MEETKEDPNEQLGKMVYSGIFLGKNNLCESLNGDEIDKRLWNNLCPRCMCRLQSVDIHGHRQCSVCKCVIVDCCDGEKNV